MSFLKRGGFQGDVAKIFPRRRNVGVADVIDLQADKRVGGVVAHLFQVGDRAIGLAQVVPLFGLVRRALLLAQIPMQSWPVDRLASVNSCAWPRRLSSNFKTGSMAISVFSRIWPSKERPQSINHNFHRLAGATLAGNIQHPFGHGVRGRLGTV